MSTVDVNADLRIYDPGLVPQPLQWVADGDSDTGLAEPVKDAGARDLLATINAALTAIGAALAALAADVADGVSVSGAVDVTDRPGRDLGDVTVTSTVLAPDAATESTLSALAADVADGVDVTDRAARQVGLAGVTQGGNVAEVRARTDGRIALEVSENFESFQSRTLTLVPNTDTPIDFDQPVGMIRVKNWSITKRLLAKDGVIVDASDADATRIAQAPVAGTPGKDTFVYRGAGAGSIHLLCEVAAEVSVEGYF